MKFVGKRTRGDHNRIDIKKIRIYISTAVLTFLIFLVSLIDRSAAKAVTPILPPPAARESLSAKLFSSSPLPSYNINPRGITVSGVSSGAYMAVQMEVAFSASISGVGSIAGGIYDCARGDVQRAQINCMALPSTLQPADQAAEARKLADSGDIDPIENLAVHRIYIFAGTKDTLVQPLNADKLREFYSGLTPAKNIQTVKQIPAAHGFPTLDFGVGCGIQASPWLQSCSYDGAGEILKSMYPQGEDSAGWQARTSADPSHLIRFSQAEFDGGDAALYPDAWIYVPKACAAGELCRLHVALHGCQMNPDYVQDTFVRHAGYNEWAESNHVIVLYPQANKVRLSNPYACWDWYGYTGAGYATKSGPQMLALKKMIDRLTGVDGASGGNAGGPADGIKSNQK